MPESYPKVQVVESLFDLDGDGVFEENPADPAAGDDVVSLTYYNLNGGATRTVDTHGDVTLNTYDKMNRVTETRVVAQRPVHVGPRGTGYGAAQRGVHNGGLKADRWPMDWRSVGV